ncbi:MAG: hypothetical protein AAFR61_20105 [Bacteroidota bacterium]
MHNTRFFLQKYLLLSVLILVGWQGWTAVEAKKRPEVIVIHAPDKPKSEKEALMILPGLGDGKKGRKHQKEQFGNTTYDLYIPSFIDKHSFEGSVENLKKFYEVQELGRYRKVHVLSYILGSWVMNTFLKEFNPPNIATIIYDRSPLQERAPRLISDKFPRIGKWYVGQVALDLSEIAYPTIDKDDIRIGILVESKATNIVKLFKKTVVGYGEVDWNKPDIRQQYNDLMYIILDHDEMYARLDVIRAELLTFIETGSFSEAAQRKPFSWDPFDRPKM